MIPLNNVQKDALFKAFPYDFEEILRDVKYSSINGCHYFTRWGMYIGIESDGYIHS